MDTPPRQGFAVADRWHRLQRDHPRSVDASLALVSFALAFPGSLLNEPGVRSQYPWWSAVLVSGVASVSLMWRRTHPLAVAVISCSCAVVVTLLGFQPTALLLVPTMVALFTLADRTNRKLANSVTLATACLVPLVAIVTRPHVTIALTVFAPIAILVLPTALGTTALHRRAYIQAAQARAEDAERTREQEARNRAGAERVRIARELHDIVAHHFALANAQAGAVVHLMRADPEKAHEIATELMNTTSTALRELKATVSLLRQGDEPQELAPAPGLAQLPQLASSLEAVGLHVTIHVEGPEQPLSPGVDLTAYRIAQEALTNVTKHARTHAAHVSVTHARGRVTVSIANEDDGVAPVAPSLSSGFGLLGMRERAHSVGGTVRAGSRPGGGYEVVAELPLHL